MSNTGDTDWFIDLLADFVHEEWLDAKRVQGVTSRLAEDGEELCVPYAELSEEARELDRVTVRAVLTALGSLGALR